MNSDSLCSWALLAAGLCLMTLSVGLLLQSVDADYIECRQTMILEIVQGERESIDLDVINYYCERLENGTND